MRVRDELLDRHRTFRNRRRVRLSRAALVPLHDDKFSLERCVDMGKRHLWEARPAMQKKEDWFCAIIPANLKPLLDATETDLLDRSDPGRRNNLDSAGGRALKIRAPHSDSDYTRRQSSSDSEYPRFHNCSLSDRSFQSAKITG